VAKVVSKSLQVTPVVKQVVKAITQNGDGELGKAEVTEVVETAVKEAVKDTVKEATKEVVKAAIEEALEVEEAQ